MWLPHAANLAAALGALALAAACSNGGQDAPGNAGTVIILGDGKALAVDGGNGDVTPRNGPLKDVYYIPSPDGRSLLIACGDDATAYIRADDTGLCMYGPDGYVQLTDSGDLARPSFTETDWGSLDAAWRPDSGAIAYLARERAAPDVLSSGDLYVLDLASGATARIAEGAFGEFRGPMKWSADGTRLLMRQSSTLGAHGDRLLVFDAASGATVEVSRLEGAGSIEQYAWSPDGTAVAFTYNAGSVTLFVASADAPSADGAGARALTSVWPGTEPAWSPDGEWIAATDVFSSRGGVFIVRSDGSGERREIGEGLTASDRPTWSPDGQIVAFEGTTSDEFGDRGLYVYDVETEQLREVTREPPLAFAPLITFSRDSERIFYTADAPPCREGCPPGRMYVVEVDGDAAPRRITDELVSQVLSWEE